MVSNWIFHWCENNCVGTGRDLSVHDICGNDDFIPNQNFGIIYFDCNDEFIPNQNSGIIFYDFNDEFIPNQNSGII